ncbi:unnamed protein product [Leptospira phage LE1]|uniref:Uncharacterized protein n=1 Tax=Leptospira phage LE1 TaxID=137511 RepID=Q6NDY7_9CAUD|nr:hypothetical protein HWD53_gp56 [Leptospira phage LE1]CAE14751.1 unnamed protein product [Leptospira phage LE1]
MINQCNRHQAITGAQNDPPNVIHGTSRTSGDYFLDPTKEGDQWQSSNHPIIYPPKTLRIKLILVTLLCL